MGVTESKYAFYAQLHSFAESLTSGESDLIANLSNISALLFDQMPDVNWAGFYFYKEEQLVLGPFQGKPACIRIPLGKGVCGVAAEKQEPMLVNDVHEFDGHIACDAASNSEIVLPIVVDGKLIGVLDIDSPSVGRFEQADINGLLPIVNLIQSKV
ncbi:GAF domain-containing protein [Alteromonadaceae bacterium M269]|nr:GAF domain-containing protein [Alteromonadaceae bacterium M269]